MEFQDVRYAQRFLRRFAEDARNDDTLRCSLLETTCASESCNCPEAACLQRLADALVLGHLKIVSEPLRPPETSGQPPKPVDPVDPEEPPLIPPEPVEPLKWVEFIILDNETNDPYADAALLVTLPGHGSLKYEANPSGVIRIENIEADSTSCDVDRLVAPEILEVISIS
jgi:hypothetical protein